MAQDLSHQIALGTPKGDLDTPCFVIDLDLMERNKVQQTAPSNIIQMMLKNADAADYSATEQEQAKGGTK